MKDVPSWSEADHEWGEAGWTEPIVRMTIAMSDPIDEIAALCQQVALGMCDWDALLRRLASLTGSARAQLIGIGGPAVTAFNYVSDLGWRDLERLLDADGYRPDVNFRIASSVTAREMELVHEDDYDRVAASLSSDLYVQYCEEIGIPLGCQVKLFADGDRQIGLAALRERADGRTTPEQLALFAQAAPHVRAAVHLQMRIEQQGQALLVGGLEAMSANVVLLDAYGRVCGLTPGAEAILSSDGRLRLVDGRLSGSTAIGSARIDSAIGRVLRDRADPAGVDVLLAPQDDARGALTLGFKSLQPGASALGIQPRAIVVIGSGLLAGDAARRLRNVFGLTEAEAEVALALSSGRPRAMIAAARGVSIGTIRSQIKAIFRKVGVNREAELFSLMIDRG